MQTTLEHNDIKTETRARAIGGIVLMSRELRLRLRLSDEILSLPEVNFPVARVAYLKKTARGNVDQKVAQKRHINSS